MYENLHVDFFSLDVDPLLPGGVLFGSGQVSLPMTARITVWNETGGSATGHLIDV